jgi:hypothetical protein
MSRPALLVRMDGLRTSCDPLHLRRARVELPRPPPGNGHGGRRVDATRATGRDLKDETVQTTVIFCGIGLFVSLLFVAYGLDLCPRFF